MELGVVRKSHLGGVLTVLMCLSVTVGGPIASAQPDTAQRYVALGSSYASGPGIEPMEDRGCMRSAGNYPHRLAAGLGLELVDATCAGATTADVLLGRQQQVPGGGTVAAPQVDSVTPDTTLVTVSIGGNDLGLIGGMLGRSCGPLLAPNDPAVAATASRACATALGAANPPAPADFAAVQQSMVDIVGAVRARAPRARVLLVEYLPVLDPTASTCPDVPLAPADAVAARHTYDGLIAATRAAAAAAGAVSVAVPGAETHTACAAAPWVNGLRDPLTTGDPAAVAGAYHPNSAGMAATADRSLQLLGS